MITAALHLTLSLLLFFPTSLLSQNPSSRALLKFKNSLSNSDSLTNWNDNAGESPCSPENLWVGVVCNMDTVSSINLTGMGLQGVPNVGAFASLEELKAISLENNSLVGPIPAFNRLTGLKAIYASKNQFSGIIPPNYFQPLGSVRRIWLSHNKFSGPIPESLVELSDLKELHLENNEFSGPIPDFSDLDDSNLDLDLSNNKLEGRIPGPMNKFDKKVFENNPELCGPKASKDCPIEILPPDDSHSNLSKKLIIACIVLILLILIVSVKEKRKQENLRILTKGANDEAVVSIPASISRRNSLSKKGYTSLKTKNKNKLKPKDADASLSPKGGSGQPPVAGELVMVNEDKGVFGPQDLMKASAEVLGGGGLGSAYKATLGNGVSVVLKKVKEMNSMSKDVLDLEMKKLGKLKHQNILTLLAYQVRKEHKFLVSEYVPTGSLHYVLHGDNNHSELSWANRLKIVKGVARGLGYLHSELASYELPHGNLKSCNVLIGANHEPLVTDYALYPLINQTPAVQSMFAYKSPEAMLRQPVSPKSDVYCLGIVILEIVTGKYPSQYPTSSQKGGTDVVQWVRSALDEKRERELIDQKLASDAKGSVVEIEKLLHIGADCTESEVDRRIDITEAVRRIEEISV